MGFQYRKRKNGVNTSFSSRKGPNASLSFTSKKSGERSGITHNVSLTDRRGDRTTFNFGGGLRYVKYGKTPTKEEWAARRAARATTLKIVVVAAIAFMLYQCLWNS